jgi:glutamate:Na+ symporter, ESS family
MSAWDLNITIGDFFLDFAWMGLLLVIASLARRYVPLFQRFLVPNNLIAGIIALLIGMNGLGLLGMESGRLGAYVYHLLALLFIALSLRSPQKKLGLTSIKFGLIFLMTYLIQGLIGLALAFLLIYTIMPDLFAGIGLLLPLAFGMNPGIAYTIGQNWENYGFESGSIVGLSFAAMGFLVAYTVGIVLMRKGIREGRATYIGGGADVPDEIRTGFLDPGNRKSGGHLTTSPEAIESLTLHLSLVGFTYVLTWGLMKLMEGGLIVLGAAEEITTLWSFHFIFAAVTALGFRMVLDNLKLSFLIDDVTMTRTSNLFMDFMIVASVAAISFAVVMQYWLPILLLSVVVALGTWMVVQWATRSAFRDFILERFMAIFGNMTGTLQSGLILLRVLDPEMKSPVSHNLVYGSGLALALGFPLLIIINAPVHRFDDIMTGFWMVFAALLAYLALILLAWRFIQKR